MAIGPVAGGVFEKIDEAASFDLRFGFFGKCQGADFGEGREKIEVGGERSAVGWRDGS